MEEIINIGASEKIDLFEGQYVVPNGMSYNSYIIIDEQVAIFETVDPSITEKWLINLQESLQGRIPDYLIISHMEPDHSSNIKTLIDLYPNITIVGNAKTFLMLPRYIDIADTQTLVVKENDVLNLGEHELQFIFAPMVHWPEVMMTYDRKTKALYSADAFGKFGAKEVDEPWDDEARRYYINIVGKYGPQVQGVFKKLAGLEIASICPLHGPVLTDNLSHYLALYDTWSSYRPEVEGIFIAYNSIYGNTEKVCFKLKEMLEANGKVVAISDLARTDMSQNIANAFKYSKVVFASTTYDASIFPAMNDFLNHLIVKNYQNRKVAYIQNGSWAPLSAKLMNELIGKMKNMTVCETVVTIPATMTESTQQELQQLIKELI